MDRIAAATTAMSSSSLAWSSPEFESFSAALSTGLKGLSTWPLGKRVMGTVGNGDTTGGVGAGVELAIGAGVNDETGLPAFVVGPDTLVGPVGLVGFPGPVMVGSVPPNGATGGFNATGTDVTGDEVMGAEVMGTGVMGACDGRRVVGPNEGAGVATPVGASDGFVDGISDGLAVVDGDTEGTLDGGTVNEATSNPTSFPVMSPYTTVFPSAETLHRWG